jgi:hypothetical protein
VDRWKMVSGVNNFELARLWYGIADAKRWQVARLAYFLRSRRDVLRMADAINRGEDTVKNLSDAYTLFVQLVLDAWKDGKSSEPIRNLRRKHPYTRWAVVCRSWRIYEFDLDEARDWLENFGGGNDAMSAEIENKHGAPEWERRANVVYRQAYKLQTDFGVPDGLQKAAVLFVAEFENWEKGRT